MEHNQCRSLSYFFGKRWVSSRILFNSLYYPPLRERPDTSTSLVPLAIAAMEGLADLALKRGVSLRQLFNMNCG